MFMCIGVSVSIYASISVSVAISVRIYVYHHPAYQLRCANCTELHESLLSAHIHEILL